MARQNDAAIQTALDEAAIALTRAVMLMPEGKDLRRVRAIRQEIENKATLYSAIYRKIFGGKPNGK